MAEGKTRVLLVDDHLKLLTFVKIGLIHQGFEVTTAESGQKGLDAVKSEEPQAILLDIRMPDMDGFEVLRRLRKFSQIPVIAYSATPEYNSVALESGANAFIAKPFDIEKLVDLIRELTNHREAKSG